MKLPPRLTVFLEKAACAVTFQLALVLAFAGVLNSR